MHEDLMGDHARLLCLVSRVVQRSHFVCFQTQHSRALACLMSMDAESTRICVTAVIPCEMLTVI